MTTSKNSTDDPRVDRILALLEYEITRLESESTRSGWTTWALCGTFGTLLWLVLETIEKGEHSWPRVLLLVVLLSVCFEALFTLTRCLRRDHISSAEKGRFGYFDQDLYGVRFSLLGIVVRFSALMAVVSFIPIPVTWVRYALYVYISISLLMATMGFILSFVHAPTPRIPQAKSAILGWVLILLWFGVCLAVIFGVVRQILADQQQFDLEDWRLAILLFAAIFLALVMSRQEHKSAILPHLHGLRRRVSLGRIEYDDAVRESDLLLHGLSIGNVLEKQITDVLNALAEDQSLIDRCHSEFRVLQDIVSDMKSGVSASSGRSIHDLVESMTALTKKETDAWQRYEKTIAILFKRSAFLIGMCPDSAEGLCAVIEQVKRALESRGEKVNAIEKSLVDIKNSLKDTGKENTQGDIGQKPPGPSVLGDSDTKP